MSVNAFGIDHSGGISKADDPSTGRQATTAAAPGWHGAVAGKKGKKLAAAGSEIGHNYAGQLAGAVAGSALTRGSRGGMMLGGAAGGIAGSVRAAHTNQAKGRYKPDPGAVGKREIVGVHKAFTKTKERHRSDKKLSGSLTRREKVGATLNGGLYTAAKAPRGQRGAAVLEHGKYMTGGKGKGVVGVKKPGLTHRGAYAHTKQVQGW